MTDIIRELREEYPAVDVTTVVFSADFSGVGCCVIPQDRVLAITGDIEALVKDLAEAVKLLDALLGLEKGSGEAALAFVEKHSARPFYGAECPTYPNCEGGCGLGCTKEIERAKAHKATEQPHD